MEAVQYKIGINTYTILPTTEIDSIYETIKEYLASIDVDLALIEEEYKANILLSINQNNAFKALLNDKEVGFLYIYVLDGKLYGAAMHSTDPIAMIALFYKITNKYPYNKLVRLVPHETNIQYFKSLIDAESMRRYNRGELKYITINIVNIKTKMINLFYKYYNQ